MRCLPCINDGVYFLSLQQIFVRTLRNGDACFENSKVCSKCFANTKEV